MCEICHGYPGCPVCSPEPRMIECPSCQGHGYIWHRYDIEENEETEVTEEEFNTLPVDEDEAAEKGERYCQGDKETCPVCDGTGEIEEDYELYEPEWDD